LFNWLGQVLTEWPPSHSYSYKRHGLVVKMGVWELWQNGENMVNDGHDLQ
jgi:hypothetical protein